MKTRLTKTTRTTTDANGVRFRYAGYRVTMPTGELAEARYVAEGMGIEAPTLAELRRKVAALK